MSWLDELLDDRIRDRCDVAGRPLGEQASSIAVETRLLTCPFADSRKGGTMNSTGYRQVEAHWPQVLAALRSASGPTAADAWRATCRLRWRPLDLPDPLSEETAAQFKTALGLTRPLSSWLLLSPGAAARPLFELVPPEALLERLDREGWLIGAHQVCAGPPVRIVEAWRALGEPSAEVQDEGADRAMNLVVGLWAILGAAREVIRSGRLDEAPHWPAVDGDGPEVLRLLQLRGPGALVREVPRFEPEWALHVYADPPPAVVEAVRGARLALGDPRPFRALDATWERLLRYKGA